MRVRAEEKALQVWQLQQEHLLREQLTAPELQEHLRELAAQDESEYSRTGRGILAHYSRAAMPPQQPSASRKERSGRPRRSNSSDRDRRSRSAASAHGPTHGRTRRHRGGPNG